MAKHELYPIYRLRRGKKLEDFGKVVVGQIKDDFMDYETHSVQLTQDIKLVYANNNYYIDKVYEIRRLTAELIAQYNLEKFFEKVINEKE